MRNTLLLLLVLLTGCQPWGATAPTASNPLARQEHQVRIVPVNRWTVTPAAIVERGQCPLFLPAFQTVRPRQDGTPMAPAAVCTGTQVTIWAFSLPRQVLVCGLAIAMSAAQTPRFQLKTFPDTDTDCRYRSFANGTVRFIYNLKRKYRPNLRLLMRAYWRAKDSPTP